MLTHNEKQYSIPSNLGQSDILTERSTIMGITKTWGYTAPTSTFEKVIPVLDLGNFAEENSPAMSTNYKNITSPTDQPESVRIATRVVKNVYTGSGVLPSFVSTTKEGVSSLIQVKDILTVQPDYDSTSASESCCTPWRIDLPAKVNITIQVPKSRYFGSTEAMAVIDRAIAILQHAATDTTTLDKILRGSTSVLG